jgi:alpha-L-rhamnosidase
MNVCSTGICLNSCRRILSFGFLAAFLISLPASNAAAATGEVKQKIFSQNHMSIADFGAIGDGVTLNTKYIQSAFDQLAAKDGGTVVIPKGIFLSGAIFLKPGVNLHFEKDAVLKGSTNTTDYPEQRIRIEGHFEPSYSSGLINAEGCDGLHITGAGTLDGSGRPIWDKFWELRDDAVDKKNFKNLSILRAQLCIINNSKNVVIDGITFKDSQYWNLHLYKCRNALVQNARFQVPDDYKQAPSTDGIDVDSCQGVTINRCYFSVTDDCIALKGSKGPFAMDDKDSPPVEHIRVKNCTFKRGGGVLTLGSEATLVRDVVVENCKVIGAVNVAVLKLRPDTPQHYEDIHYRNITLEHPESGTLISIKPWTQYYDLQGQPPPKSIVKNVTLSDVKGAFGSLGEIAGNPGQTQISNITLRNIDVRLKNENFSVINVANLKMGNVRVNGKPFSVKSEKQ